MHGSDTAQTRGQQNGRPPPHPKFEAGRVTVEGWQCTAAEMATVGVHWRSRWRCKIWSCRRRWRRTFASVLISGLPERTPRARCWVGTTSEETASVPTGTTGVEYAEVGAASPRALKTNAVVLEAVDHGVCFPMHRRVLTVHVFRPSDLVIWRGAQIRCHQLIRRHGRARHRWRRGWRERHSWADWAWLRRRCVDQVLATSTLVVNRHVVVEVRRTTAMHTVRFFFHRLPYGSFVNLRRAGWRLGKGLRQLKTRPGACLALFLALDLAHVRRDPMAWYCGKDVGGDATH